ncbi:hypothetical protein CLV56_0288 [Mumia flava]|uniref:PspA-associated domain-containing protein n=1 Tax=Mumia flava TaxID=1348852 RepID=A0A0B2B2Q7_9ACTN|nr:hypothetical protein [Mumia flava]PJJ56084.1 hypothetical protein CLV56_0288 [Mumia flava]
MIVRILTEGQFRVPDADVERLEALDDAVEAAVTAHDDAAFVSALNDLLGAVRDHGTPVPDAEIVESDLILPASDSSIHEVEELLGADGFIPG